MRGLVTAGRAVRQERIACLESSVAQLAGLLIAESRVAPRAAATSRIDEADRVGLLLEHGQRPAPAGQLAGDGDGGHNVPLVSGTHGVPAMMQPPVALITASPGCWAGQLPAITHGLADPVGGAVVPGSLDQQSTQMAVPGLGDRALHP